MPDKKPEESDVFREGPDWWNNAIADYRPGDWWPYVNGYLRAADHLVDKIDAGASGVDSLVYPIMFLYRHYLELAMKENIRAAEWILDRPSELIQGHNLMRWADRLKAALNAISKEFEEDAPKFPDLDRVVKAFHQLDPGSTVARYPLTNDMKPQNLPPRVNLRILRDRVAEASAELVGIRSVLGTVEEMKRDAENEMREELDRELRSQHERDMGFSGDDY